MVSYLKRTWAEINLDHLVYNIEKIRENVNHHTKLMAVVKADAYGHGDKVISQTLMQNQVDFFAVSNIEEAISLRKSNIKGDILILGFTPIEKADEIAALHIIQTIVSYEYAKELNSYCEKNNIKVNVHIKLDTGMGRIGIIAKDIKNASKEIEEIYEFKNLKVNGIFSHFSSADNLDEESVEYTKKQLTEFDDLINHLEQNGITFKVKHLQNSAGIAFLKDCCYDYARAGIVMYGVAPSEEALPFDIKPVMSLKSVVSHVKEIDENCAISYGRKFITNKKMKIATVPIGYADGYPRLLSNQAQMLIHGKRCNVLGNVCMDQLMLDVTELDDVKTGDIVTVVGQDGSESVTFDELSKMIGTISYELMCLVGRRVPRVYIKDNKIIDVVDYINE